MEWANEGNSVEKAADIAAAALFAAAVGFAAGAMGFDAVPTILAAVAASRGAFIALRSVSAGNRTYDLPAFELISLEVGQEAADELVLDDVLESAPADARVVRLFGPGQQPVSSNPSQPDAAQALNEALAQLRRSLR